MKKWCGFALLPLFVGTAVLYYRWPYPGLPDAADVSHMTAWLFNTDVSEFTVPPEHVPKIMQALQPAEEVDRPRDGTMGVGELRITGRDGKATRVLLHRFESGRCHFFVVYRGRRVYLRSGTDKAIEDAIRAAYADSLKTTKK
jgi:hypothetical protein